MTYCSLSASRASSNPGWNFATDSCHFLHLAENGLPCSQMTDHYHHTRSNPCWKKKPPKRQEILVKLTLVHQPARCGWTRNIWRVRDGSERWITIPQEHVDQWDVIYLVGPARYPCQRATVSLDFMMLSTTLKMDCYCSGYWVTMIILVSHLCDNITYQKNLLTPTQMRSSQDSTKVVINETMS